MLTILVSPTLLDELPEQSPYRDDGCEVSPSCLRCPLPQCKYDDPGWFQRQKRDERDREVMAILRRGGLSVAQVAARFDLSQRTVFRILRRMAMDERSSTRKKRDHDFSVTAFRVMQEATAETDNTPITEEKPPDTEGKNPNAVALGRLGGKKGGKARAANLFQALQPV